MNSSVWPIFKRFLPTKKKRPQRLTEMFFHWNIFGYLISETVWIGSIISGIVVHIPFCLWYLSMVLSFDQTDPIDVKFNGFTYMFTSAGVFFFAFCGSHSRKVPPISFHMNVKPNASIIWVLSAWNTNVTRIWHLSSNILIYLLITVSWI